MDSKQLSEVITEGGIRSVNFFNGRLLSAEDLAEEQRARRTDGARLGQAIGEGIAFGLEVGRSPEAGAAPVVSMQPGLAINRRGHALGLTARTDLTLVRPAKPEAAGSQDVFRECEPVQPGVYVVGAGVYLLAISPAVGSEGRAPVSGLGNARVSCNTRYKIQGIKFRLIPVDTQAALLQSALLRNQLAYLCYGLDDSRAFQALPFEVPPRRTSLLDRLRELKGGLTDCDVPLAMIYWTAAGIQFIDTWCVRRRLTRPDPGLLMPLLTGDRRAAEAEAMIEQFQAHIAELVSSEANPGALQATSRFRFLPPAGLLPVETIGLRKGIRPDQFFGGQRSKEIATIDGAKLRALFQESLHHEPVVLDAATKLQLYVPFENFNAVVNGLSAQWTLVFASPHLPYYGSARFDYALFESGRYAPNHLR
jgi:hypothetical protein